MAPTPKTPSPKKAMNQRLLDEAQQFMHNVKGMTDKSEGQRQSTRIRSPPKRLEDETVSPKKPAAKKTKKATPNKKTSKKAKQGGSSEEEPEEQGEPGEEKIYVQDIGWTYQSRLPENTYLLTYMDKNKKSCYYLREFTPSDEEDEETWLQNKQNRKEHFPHVDLGFNDDDSSDEEDASDGAQESDYDTGSKKRKSGKGKAKASPRKAAARKKATAKKPTSGATGKAPPPGGRSVHPMEDVIVVVMKPHEILKDYGLGAISADTQADEDFSVEMVLGEPLPRKVLSGKEKNDHERLSKIFAKLAELEQEYEFQAKHAVPEKQPLPDNNSAGSRGDKIKTEPASDDEEEGASDLEPPPPELSYHTQADEDEDYAEDPDNDEYDSLVEEFGDEGREGRRYHFVHDLTDPVVLDWVVRDIFCERHPVGGGVGAPKRMRARIGRLSGVGIVPVLSSIVDAALRLKRFTVVQQGLSENVEQKVWDRQFRKNFWACQEMAHARLSEMVAMGAWIKECWDLHYSNDDRSRWEGILQRRDRKLAVYKYYIGQAAIAYEQWRKRVMIEKNGKRTKKRTREESRGMRTFYAQEDSDDEILWRY
ncbi:hypothetical protein DL546_001290 [Coniochaeta pulveracea]|uniref:Uncharacterized protein n=1 Tax=Coniochaeta pulveracea TaxID=177199 RepID=A0A420Y1W1_9PEZI|nr:hypothetical protein DL546_001290 [Coniochaeta pulveracea]